MCHGLLLFVLLDVLYRDATALPTILFRVEVSMNSILLRKVGRALWSDTKDPQFEPMTRWQPSITIREVNALLDIRGTDGNLSVAVALQSAIADVSKPEAYELISPNHSGDGKYVTGVKNVEEYLKDKFFVRFGVVISKSSGGVDLARGEVYLQVSGRC